MAEREQARPEPDDVNGMPVAAVLVLTMLGTASGIGWLWLMHVAGTGRAPW